MHARRAVAVALPVPAHLRASSTLTRLIFAQRPTQKLPAPRLFRGSLSPQADHHDARQEPRQLIHHTLGDFEEPNPGSYIDGR